MNNLKGYRVEWSHAEHDIHVIAESVSKAKSLAKWHDWMCDAEWTELRVTRAKEFDPHVELFGRCVVNNPCRGTEKARVLHSLGWWPEEGASMCESCELYQWDEIPESYIGDDEQCVECRELGIE